MEKIKDEIAPQDTLQLAKRLGDGIYPVGGHRIVVRNKTIITIYL